MTKISLIAAVAANKVIGEKGFMPWHIPEDLAWFKANTMGKPMLMGRKTFQSFKKPLPGRPHVVVSRDPSFDVPGDVTLAGSIREGLDKAALLAGESDEIMVIGGEQIYAQTLPLADRLYVTAIHRSYQGDAHFPDFDAASWRLVKNQEQPGDPAFAFQILERIAP